MTAAGKRVDPLSLTHASVQQAAARILGAVHRTPVLTSSTFDGWAQRSLFFKCENLQRVGAFKIRGATNAVRNIHESRRMAGVLTHSSGNHAAALALAAREASVPCWVVMPTNAPEVKRDAVRGYGATIVPCAPTLEDRERVAGELAAATGATLVHSYDNEDVIAGQGTAALELLEQVPDLQAIVVPIGGGGLCAGTVLAVNQRCAVYAAEPSGADDAAKSKASGVRLPQHDPRTIADGLRTAVGQLNWPFLRDGVADVLTVDDDAIEAAMRHVWQRMKLVVEPSAAVPLAAVWGNTFRSIEGLERVGIILSGGNVALPR